jgi:DNA primase
MSLSPGFLDELRTRLSLSQVVGRKVTWDPKKSNQGKGDMWAPCPFHQEKTASFHVDDRKGFYYCFGCHQKGDAISFVRETENVGFMEAVEILAREAGMQMPARDPRAQEKADRNTRLAEVNEQAVNFFKLALKTGRAAQAREYLQKRGLPEKTLQEFEIGFAADDRTALFKHLAEKGIPAEDIVEAGLAIKPDEGGTPYDRFRGRIIFPIRDARGRCIAFGGRAMDPNARAKYLNSPETPLFDKGRSLYNHGPAREASGKSGQLIVAEGYMDVIALAQAGFGHAVAPLGTAITEDQLQLMWRLCPEPVIALDGDVAGLRAAMRLIDLALPMLEAGKSLRFCILPEGQDPDDLIKASGSAAMQVLLDGAQPLVNLLWQREIEGKVFDSPERRAALDASLREAIKKIPDPSLRRHYGDAVNELRRALFYPDRGQRPAFTLWSKGRPRAKPTATNDTKSSLLAQDGTEETIRACLILALALRYPTAALDFESELERVDLALPDHNLIRNALVRYLHDHREYPQDLQAAVIAETGAAPVEKLFSLPHVRSSPAIITSRKDEYASLALAEELAKLHAIKGSRAEIEEAEQDLQGVADEGVTWRLQQAAQARHKATRAEPKSNDDGQSEDAELSKELQKLIDDQVWVKKKR